MDIRRANTIEIVNLPVRDGIGHEANMAAGIARLPAHTYAGQDTFMAAVLDSF
jgi:hypothetical protein